MTNSRFSVDSMFGGSIRLAAMAAAGVLMAAPLAASAQDETQTRYRVALGPGFGPAYPGDDELSIGPFVDLDTAKGDEPFAHESPDEAFGFPLLNLGNVYIGPSVDIVSKRKADDTTPGLRTVGTSVELGVGTQVVFSDRLYGFAEVRRAVSGHDGWVARGGVDYVMRQGDDWLISVGPRVTWADGKQHDAYFGISPDEAIASGLPAFDADGGIQSYGATLGAEVALTNSLGLAGYAGYERLTGDAADSPVTRNFGSRDQFSFGAALTYSFTR